MSTERQVSPNGDVFWSRPGQIKTLCPMRGLQNFPFDELTCVLKFGGWVAAGEAQNVSFYDPPWSTELAPTFNFQEYIVHSEDVAVRRGVDVYSCCPGTTWPFVEYTLRIHRASAYYFNKVMFISMLLTYLSFGVFFTPALTGARALL